ncbi:hypothetical protein [Roseicella sp. DB1501]|uniref:DUF7448 domain-containing protein n=1 Tax=Roseicella sp. DB1501 TaxID=2730925 RepID=UPI001C2C57CC|nr:hypothetical protein [Roseicella sp. DB1501]
MWGDNCNLDTLLGKTLIKVEKSGDDELHFEADSGERFKLYHSQSCCESVQIEDVCGDLNDLVGSPIIKAEEREFRDENPPDVTVPDYQDSFTWTFYEFATVKGSVTVRWYGSSNGYYSESVDFTKLDSYPPPHRGSVEKDVRKLCYASLPRLLWVQSERFPRVVRLFTGERKERQIQKDTRSTRGHTNAGKIRILSI